MNRKMSVSLFETKKGHSNSPHGESARNLYFKPQIIRTWFWLRGCPLLFNLLLKEFEPGLERELLGALDVFDVPGQGQTLGMRLAADNLGFGCRYRRGKSFGSLQSIRQGSGQQRRFLKRVENVPSVLLINETVPLVQVLQINFQWLVKLWKLHFVHENKFRDGLNQQSRHPLLQAFFLSNTTPHRAY